MGTVSCSDDRYNQIKDKYSRPFQEYIIREKTRAFLFRLLGKMRQRVGQLALAQEKRVGKQIAQTQRDIEGYYQKVVVELNKRQPGGIQALEQMSRTKVEDLLDYNHLKGYVVQLRKQVYDRIKEDEIYLLDLITQTTVSYQQEYRQNETEEMKLFEALPKGERQEMTKRGEMEFQSDISRAQEYILAEYKQQLNYDNYKRLLPQLCLKQQLSTIVFISKQKLQANLNNILGQPFETSIKIQ